METLRLVVPAPLLEAQAAEYIAEHRTNGEDTLYGCAELDKMESYAAWLRRLKNNRSEETAEPGWVASSTFFVVRESDGRLVGTVDIRHRLNDFLRQYAGNIGYGVRPSERGKGYAKEILRLALGIARELGLSRVMLACDEVNLPSRRTIESAGGVLEKQAIHPDGSPIRVYWIDLA